jgi:precorrin-6B methylase 2
VDREAGDDYRPSAPEIMDVVRASRRFLDVGTGLPTADNTHEVAQRVAPEARVVYVDDDEEARSIVKRLLEALPSGSYLTVCDGTNVISQAGVARKL